MLLESRDSDFNSQTLLIARQRSFEGVTFFSSAQLLFIRRIFKRHLRKRSSAAASSSSPPWPLFTVAFAGRRPRRSITLCASVLFSPPHSQCFLPSSSPSSSTVMNYAGISGTGFSDAHSSPERLGGSYSQQSFSLKS